MISQESRSEMFRFIVTGILAVSTDCIGYFFLVEYLPVSLAKGISFIMGSVVAFFLNKIWTFKSVHKIAPAIIQFACLYSITFFANVSVNEITLLYLYDNRILGFLMATGTSTVLNYLGMKYWVFSPTQKSEDHAK